MTDTPDRRRDDRRMTPSELIAECNRRGLLDRREGALTTCAPMEGPTDPVERAAWKRREFFNHYGGRA